MGFFPSVGGAWVVSKEPFLLSSSKWLSFLKLRLSYGKVGNDGIINTPRFVHLPSIGQDQPSGSFRPGLGQISRYRITGYQNNDVTWEIAEQANLGLETKFLMACLRLRLISINKFVITCWLTVRLFRKRWDWDSNHWIILVKFDLAGLILRVRFSMLSIRIFG